MNHIVNVGVAISLKIYGTAFARGIDNFIFAIRIIFFQMISNAWSLVKYTNLSNMHKHNLILSATFFFVLLVFWMVLKTLKNVYLHF